MRSNGGGQKDTLASYHLSQFLWSNRSEIYHEMWFRRSRLWSLEVMRVCLANLRKNGMGGTSREPRRHSRCATVVKQPLTIPQKILKKLPTSICASN